MKALISACTLLLLANYCFAQHVYQIRADTVRIYNTCDTAELVLENRTQDTLGFLFNKGKGRTEFRKLNLIQVGDRSIAIEGQDTLELGTIIKVAVDTLYRSNDTLFYRKTDGQIVAVNMGYKSYGDNTYVLKNRTLAMTGGTGISIAPIGAQDLSANRSWTITNTGVISVNGATGAVTAAPASGSGNYIQSQSTTAQTTSSFWISNNGIAQALNSYAPPGSAQYGFFNGIYATANRRWTFFLTDTESGSNTGSTFKLGRYNDGGTYINSVLSIDRATGNTTLSGTLTLGIPTRSTAATVYLTHTGGEVESRTAAQVLSDIGAAPLSGSGSYIHSQFSSAQSASFWISGTGRSANQFSVARDGSNGIINSFTLYNAAVNRGANFQLTGDAIPGLATWVHDGAGWIERMRILSNGNVGIGVTAPGEKLQVQAGEIYIKSGSNANSAVHNGVKFGTDNDAGFSAIRAVRGLNSTTIGLSFFTSNATTPSEVVRLTPAGLLGIGTTAPAQLLHVNGNIQANGLISPNLQTNNSTGGMSIVGGAIGNYQGGQIALYGGVHSTYPGQIRFFTGTGTGLQSERMQIAADGNVGIGTTNPSNKLHLVGTSALSAGAVTTYAFRVSQNGSDLGVGGNASGSFLQSFNSLPLILNSAGNNVGIGTSSPASTLHVAGTARVSGVADIGNTSLVRGDGTGAASTAYMRFTASDGATRAGYVGDGSSGNSDMYLTSDAGGVRLVPLNGTSGNLNVQGTSMDYSGGRLYLNNGTSNLLYFNTVGIAAPTFSTRSAGTKVALFPAVNGTSADYALGIESSHIWSSVPQNITTVGFKWYGGTTQIARLDGTGNLALSGQVQATSFYQTSLRSLKKNIRPFEQSALQILEKAQVRTFIFKADSTGRTNIGFIADEVPDQMAAPERSGVDQANTIALLVKAVQELTEQNKALAQRMNEMELQLKAKQ